MSVQTRLSESNLPDYLRKLGVLSPGEEVSVEPAGDGNINWVRRVRVVSGPERRSWIVKQARPTLERFPQYRVTTERSVFEARYYEVVRPLDRARVCPAVVRFDESERVLVLEDLGQSERLDRRLARGGDARDAARSLGGFLAAVHGATGGPALAARFANDEMRRLHGDHIFRLPFVANDFPLAPEVRARGDALRADAGFTAIAEAAYARYLEPRGALVHGDAQAGNVLLADRGPVLLDAEIAHVGDPAFDLGTLIAHLLLPGLAAGDPGRDLPAVEAAWEAYMAGGGSVPFEDLARYAGLEMLRRTLGAARVAAVESVAASLSVIEFAERWVRTPPAHPLQPA